MVSLNLKLGVLLGSLLSAAIVVTNVIMPNLISHPSPDTSFSESIGWLVVIAIICSIGFLRVRRSSSIRDAGIAGGVISFVAFGMVMVTFLVIDNLFLAIVSQQPEKIWLFRHSGFSNMRAYLNHTNLKAFWTVLPIITAAGACCGLVGGSVRRLSGGGRDPGMAS